MDHSPLFTKSSMMRNRGKNTTGNEKASLLAFPTESKAGGMKNLHTLFALALHPQWLGSALKNYQSF